MRTSFLLSNLFLLFSFQCESVFHTNAAYISVLEDVTDNKHKEQNNIHQRTNTRMPFDN